MKRGEFLKRLGLGAIAAVAAPALLRGEEKDYIEFDGVDDYIDTRWKVFDLEHQRLDVIINATNLDGPVDLSGMDVKIQIKKSDAKYILTEGDGLTVSGNEIKCDKDVKRGQYIYELIIDNEITAIGNLTI